MYEFNTHEYFSDIEISLGKRRKTEIADMRTFISLSVVSLVTVAVVLLTALIHVAFLAGFMAVIFALIVVLSVGESNDWDDPFRRVDVYLDHFRTNDRQVRLAAATLKDLYEHSDKPADFDRDELVREALKHFRAFIDPDSGYSATDLAQYAAVLDELKAKWDTEHAKRVKENAKHKPEMDVAKGAL
jgi:hypothetical protein